MADRFLGAQRNLLRDRPRTRLAQELEDALARLPRTLALELGIGLVGGLGRETLPPLGPKLDRE